MSVNWPGILWLNMFDNVVHSYKSGKDVSIILILRSNLTFASVNTNISVSICRIYANDDTIVAQGMLSVNYNTRVCCHRFSLL